MRPRKRDPAFLQMAVLAGSGGILSIVCAIALPIWSRHHGYAGTPMFTLFAAWGIAALAGAYACLNTYFLTDPVPPRPPRSGVPLRVIHNTTVSRPSETTATTVPTQRAA